MIDFAPSNKSNMANKLPSTNLERFLRRTKSPLTRYQCNIYRALTVPNWPKWQPLNPHNFPKMITAEIFFQVSAQDNNAF